MTKTANLSLNLRVKDSSLYEDSDKLSRYAETSQELTSKEEKEIQEVYRAFCSRSRPCNINIELDFEELRLNRLFYEMNQED